MFAHQARPSVFYHIVFVLIACENVNDRHGCVAIQALSRKKEPKKTSYWDLIRLIHKACPNISLASYQI